MDVKDLGVYVVFDSSAIQWAYILLPYAVWCDSLIRMNKSSVTWFQAHFWLLSLLA